QDREFKKRTEPVKRATAAARFAGSITFFDDDPGACAPGFMLTPASQAKSFLLTPASQAKSFCCRPASQAKSFLLTVLLRRLKNSCSMLE
ncbi:MAG TPA: hypothetical protein VJ784_21290, partial [Pyrinomonadaceae bacterium]|nr:hypothetical protein [Pyrinomonadaceae bacterium]